MTFDVIAVNMRTNKVSLIAEGATQNSADAVETMTAMRRGVDEEFFATVRHGTYKEGDEWTGEGE